MSQSILFFSILAKLQFACTKPNSNYFERFFYRITFISLVKITKSKFIVVGSFHFKEELIGSSLKYLSLARI